MNLQAIMSALPWVRRVWKVMPPALRVPVLLIGAAVALWYAAQGREELREQEQAAWEPGPPPPPATGGPSDQAPTG